MLQFVARVLKFYNPSEDRTVSCAFRTSYVCISIFYRMETLADMQGVRSSESHSDSFDGYSSFLSRLSGNRCRHKFSGTG